MSINCSYHGTKKLILNWKLTKLTFDVLGENPLYAETFAAMQTRPPYPPLLVGGVVGWFCLATTTEACLPASIGLRVGGACDVTLLSDQSRDRTENRLWRALGQSQTSQVS